MNATRREFVKAALATSVGAVSSSGKLPAATPPNILLLFPDQWRFDWHSKRADLEIRTPNIDSLRAHGMSFDHATVASPVCAPSRACIATGREYERCGTLNNGVNLPESEATFYQRLRDSGYHVMGCGKFDLAKGASWWGMDGRWRLDSWGFSDGINNAGKWDQLDGLRLNNNVPPEPYTRFLDSRQLLEAHVADYRQRQKEQYAAIFPTPLPDDAYCDNWVSRNALTLLQRAPAKPWFMQVNWTGPHDPEDITASMEKSVRGLRMPEVHGTNAYTQSLNRNIRQNYTAMCENIDRGVGDILSWLQKSGQAANTIIIFSSDHGEMLGDLGRWGKSVPFAASVGVPLVIVGADVRQGSQSSALVSSIDVTATILDFAGLTMREIDGRSLRPVLSGRVETHRRVVYSGLGGWRMVTDGRYKVVTGFTLGSGQNGARLSKTDPQVVQRPVLVYDNVADPSEMNPLGAVVPKQASDLLELLRAGNYPA